MDWVACSVALVGSVLVAADGFATIAPPDAATSAAATTVSGAAPAATGAAAALATAQDGLVGVATKAADVVPPAENVSGLRLAGAGEGGSGYGGCGWAGIKREAGGSQGRRAGQGGAGLAGGGRQVLGWVGSKALRLSWREGMAREGKGGLC